QDGISSGKENARAVVISVALNDEPDPGTDPEPDPGDEPKPDPEPDPGEDPEGEPRYLYPSGETDAFTAAEAASYIGWLRDADGRLAGTLSVKTAKAKAGKTSKVTISATLLGQRKESYRTAILPAAGVQDEFGIVYYDRGLGGTFQGYEVIAGRDFTKSRDKADKALVEQMPQGVWTMAFASADGTAVFSLTVLGKGRAKVYGTLADGQKVCASAQGVLGEDGVFAVPFAYAKRGAAIGFVVWIDARGKAVVTDGAADVGGDGVIAPYTSPAEGMTYYLDCELPVWRDYLTELAWADGVVSLLPGDVPVTSAKRRLTTPRTSGLVKFDRNTQTAFISAGKGKAPENLSALRFSLTAKTGVVRGSCKLYYLDGTRVRTDKVAFGGVVVGDEIIGSGQVRKLGSFAFRLR
ncbi:MAG: hypothetical protein ACI4R9_00210, partial [Kiritimatiellia bacterium]